MLSVLFVGIGGAAGAFCRAYATIIIKRWYQGIFPAATFFINMLGSFLIGLLLPLQGDNLLWLFLGTGFLGGFTTFSTFQLELFTLYENKNYLMSAIYALLSFLLCIAAASFGILISL